MKSSSSPRVTAVLVAIFLATPRPYQRPVPDPGDVLLGEARPLIHEHRQELLADALGQAARDPQLPLVVVDPREWRALSPRQHARCLDRARHHRRDGQPGSPSSGATYWLAASCQVVPQASRTPVSRT